MHTGRILSHVEANRISVSVSAPKLPEAQFRLRFRLRSRSQGRVSVSAETELRATETGLLTSDVLVLACIKYKPGLYQHPTVGYTGEAASQRGGRVHCCTNDGQCGATPHTAAAVTRPRQSGPVPRPIETPTACMTTSPCTATTVQQSVLN